MLLVTKKVSELKPHPMNSLLFDDIEGEKWEEFLSSVRRNGIINPLVITEDGTIISGHQRLRACFALHMDEVQCYVSPLRKGDDILLALIECNIRQRGVINSPSVKLGRMITELERIHGADKRKRGGKPSKKTVTRRNIREHLGIDKRVACCAKAVAQMPGEIQDQIENGTITARIAYEVVSKLTPGEQVELSKQLDPVRKYTQSQIKEAIERFFPDAKKVEELQEKLAAYASDDSELELREKLCKTQLNERKAYENYQAERRQRKKDRAEFEKRMDAMEKLLEEQGGDSAEIARLIEERDQYMKDTDTAQADADLQLVIGLISGISSALSEVANDPRPLEGSLACSAASAVSLLENRLQAIKARMKHGTAA